MSPAILYALLQEMERRKQFEMMSHLRQQRSDMMPPQNSFKDVPAFMRNYLAPTPFLGDQMPTQPSTQPRSRMGVPTYGIRG